MLGSHDHFAATGFPHDRCVLCHAPASHLPLHLSTMCPILDVRGKVEGWDVATCFDFPTHPARFVQVLAAMDALANVALHPGQL